MVSQQEELSKIDKKKIDRKIMGVLCLLPMITTTLFFIIMMISKSYDAYRQDPVHVDFLSAFTFMLLILFFTIIGFELLAPRKKGEE